MNIITRTDAITLLKEARGQADLIIADPPFNIGYTYNSHDDNQPTSEFLAFSDNWLNHAYLALKPNGSLAFLMTDAHVAQLVTLATRVGFRLRNWIVWTYTFGQNTTTKFTNCKTHIIYVTKSSTFTWNPMIVPSRRQELGDKRAAGNKGMSDVWDFPRIVGNSSERVTLVKPNGSLVQHSCQMPIEIPLRLITALTNKDDLIIDPFSGSGTVSRAAQLLGRNSVACDTDADYVLLGQARLNT